MKQIRKTEVLSKREAAHEGVEGIGCVIRDASGKAVAAMSISLPVLRINGASRKRLVTLARLGASLISYRLGYRDLANPVYDIQQIRSWWEQNQTDSIPEQIA